MADGDLPDIDPQSYVKYKSDQLGDYAATKIAPPAPVAEAPAPVSLPDLAPTAYTPPIPPTAVPEAAPAAAPVETPPEAPAAPAPAAALPDWVPDHVKSAVEEGQTPAAKNSPLVDAATAKAVQAGAIPADLARARQMLGRGDYLNLCEQFSENVQGKNGVYPSAIAAANDLRSKGLLNPDISQARPGDIPYYGPHAENGGFGHTGVINTIDGKPTVISPVSLAPNGERNKVSNTPWDWFRSKFLGFFRPGSQPGDVPQPNVSLPDVDMGSAQVFRASTLAEYAKRKLLGPVPPEVQSAPQSLLDYAASKVDALKKSVGEAVGPVGEFGYGKSPGAAVQAMKDRGVNLANPLDVGQEEARVLTDVPSQLIAGTPYEQTAVGNAPVVGGAIRIAADPLQDALLAATGGLAAPTGLFARASILGAEGATAAARQPDATTGSVALAGLTNAALAGAAEGAGGPILRGVGAVARPLVEGIADTVRNIAGYFTSPVVSEIAPGIPGMGGGAALPKLADVLIGPDRPPQQMASIVNGAIKNIFNTSAYDAPTTRGLIFQNANYRRAWDATAGMLRDSIERIVPDAADRARIVTEYNDPAARATWNPAMESAARVWDTTQQNIFDLAKKAGVINNYLDEYMARIAKRPQGGGPGMANFSDYAPAGNQRKAPTYADFSAAIQKMGLEPVTDLGDVINAHVDSVGRAVENARFVQFLKNHVESDGRPTLWTDIKANPPGDYETVPIRGLSRFVYHDVSQNPDVSVGILRDVPLRVHPDALRAFQDLVPQAHGALDPIASFISHFNRTATWGIMYNPAIHGANVAGPGMAGSTWSNALTGGAQSWRRGISALRNDPIGVLELTRAGLDSAANRQAREALFDATVNRAPDLVDRINNLPVVGGIKNASDSLLWDHIVQPYHVGSALLLRDSLMRGGALANTLPAGLSDALSNIPLAGKAFRAGMDKGEATQVAARLSNVMFGQIPQETLSSAARKWAGLALFARNWTLGLARTYGGALGIYKDAQLQPEMRTAFRQTMADYVARSVLMGAGIHEALNYHFSGHNSLDNAPGHQLDIAVKDAKGIEHYYSFPLFKQIQDAFGAFGFIPALNDATGKNPITMAYSKMSPFLHSALDLGASRMNVGVGMSMANGKAVPLYSPKDGPFVQALKTAAELAGDTTPIQVRTTTANGPEQIEGPFGATYTPDLGRLSGPEKEATVGGSLASMAGVHERDQPSSIAAQQALDLTTKTINQLQERGAWDKLTPAEQSRVTSEIHAAYTERVNLQTFGTEKTPQSEMAAITRRLNEVDLTPEQRADAQLRINKQLKAVS